MMYWITQKVCFAYFAETFVKSSVAKKYFARNKYQYVLGSHTFSVFFINVTGKQVASY